MSFPIKYPIAAIQHRSAYIWKTRPKLFPRLVAVVCGSFLFLLCIGCGPSVHQLRTLESFSSSSAAVGKLLEDDLPTMVQVARHLEMTAIALRAFKPPLTAEQLSAELIEQGVQNQSHGLEILRGGAAWVRAVGSMGSYIAHDDPEGASTCLDSMSAFMAMEFKDSLWPPPNFHSENAKELGLPAPPLKFSEADLNQALEKYRGEFKRKLIEEAFKGTRKERFHHYAVQMEEAFGKASLDFSGFLSRLSKRLDDSGQSIRHVTWSVIADDANNEATRMVAVERHLRTIQVLELSKKFTQDSTIVLKQFEAASHSLKILQLTNYSMQDVDRFVDRMDDITKRVEKLASIAKRIVLILAPVL